MAADATRPEESAFSCRGTTVLVQTTKTAELDFALRELTPSDIEGIGRNLKDIAVSQQDRFVGDVVVRPIAFCNVDVMFVTTQTATGPLITVVGATHPASGGVIEKILSVVGTVAILRRASGL